MEKFIQPNHLWLEVTNRCNADCIFCGRQYIDELHDMDFNLYKKIINSCPTAKIVQTQGVGEPLMYPHIIEAVSYARRKGKNVVFYTNASLLDSSMAERLLDVGLNRIIFSVDECTKEGYESLRRGLKWETVLGNIKRFEKLKKKGGYKTKTQIRMTRTKENRSRMPGIIAFWRGIVKTVVVRQEVYIPPPNMLRENKYSSGKPIKCKRITQHLSVKSNGDLVLCCRDWFNVYLMGNLKDKGILDVFNGEKFNEVRNSMAKGVNYPSICNYCKVAPKR